MPDAPPPTPPAQPPPPPMPQSAYGQPPGQPPSPGSYPPQSSQPMAPAGAQFMPGQYVQGTRPSNGVGTAGGIVGIIAVVLLWFPYLGLILGLIGVVLGAVGLSRSNRLYGAGRGMSIVGIVCGAVALLLNVLFIAVIYTAFNTVH
ncbi:MAG: DUF4190 domain-containing protein [Candidatus Dormibacter sp.]